MLQPRHHSLRVKLLIFFLALQIGLSGLLAITGTVNTRRLDDLYTNRAMEETEDLQNSLDQDSALTKAMVGDYSVWDDTYDYLLGNLPEYPELNISDSSLATFKSDIIWLYKKDFSLATSFSKTDTTPDLTVNKQKIINAFEQNYVVHFYVDIEGGLLEVFGATVVPSDDYQHVDDSSGYLFVGRLITDKELESLQDEYTTSVKFIKKQDIANYPLSLPAKGGRLVLTIEKKDINDNTIGYIYAIHRAGTLQDIDTLVFRLLLLNGFTFLILVLVSSYVAWKWIIQPLNAVYSSLESKQTHGLQGLISKDNEFGKIAALISDFFTQQDKLEAEMKEKASIFSTLEQQTNELVKTNTAMIGRELRMIELKKEIKDLKAKLDSKNDKS